MKRKPIIDSVEDIKKIIIVSVHSSKNAGDYALLSQTIHYLKVTFPKATFAIVANWPLEQEWSSLNVEVIASPWWLLRIWDKKLKPRRQVLAFLFSFLFLGIYLTKLNWLINLLIPKDWLSLYEGIRTADMVVGVSGNQLFSSGKFGWPIPVIGLPICLGKLFKKKVIIFPQSIGPFSTKFEKILVGYLYEGLTKVFIRDHKSLELTRELHILKSKPSFMFDPAFTLPAASEERAKAILEPFGYKAEGIHVGLTVIAAMPSYLNKQVIHQYYYSIAEVIKRLIAQENLEIYIFCQVIGPTEDEDDRKAVAEVIRLLGEPNPKRVIPIYEEHTPEELKACYGLMDCFIASRLHSGIFSFSMETPTLFIGYLHKTLGVLKALDMAKFVIDIKDLSTSNLWNKTTDMISNRNTIVPEIKAQMRHITDKLDGLPNELIEVTIE